MKSIEELIARQRIGETLARYCNHLDRMTLDDLGQLFTEDCAVSFGPNPNLEANGREALITSLARLWRWHRTAHHLCNVVIRFDTIKKATVQSRVHAWHETRDGTEAEIFGTYKDSMVERNDTWLIQTRRMEMNGSRGIFNLPVPAAFRKPPPKNWVKPLNLDEAK